MLIILGFLNGRKSFNSTLVQLKGARLEEAGYNPYSFNSTLVQLKDTSQPSDASAKSSFNSTLVQLKVLLAQAIDKIKGVSILP